MKSKFSNISYPIFGLSKKPKLNYEGTKLYLTKNKVWYLLNDTSINCNYIDKLLLLKNRVKFDYTCRSLNELILSKVVWGVDNKCNIYDLSVRQKFKFCCRKIIDQKDKYIIVKDISYPFIIPEQFNQANMIGMYAHLAYIEYCWYIITISHFFNDNGKITL